MKENSEIFTKYEIFIQLIVCFTIKIFFWPSKKASKKLITSSYKFLSVWLPWQPKLTFKAKMILTVSGSVEAFSIREGNEIERTLFNGGNNRFVSIKLILKEKKYK